MGELRVTRLRDAWKKAGTKMTLFGPGTTTPSCERHRITKTMKARRQAGLNSTSEYTATTCGTPPCSSARAPLSQWKHRPNTQQSGMQWHERAHTHKYTLTHTSRRCEGQLARGGDGSRATGVQDLSSGENINTKAKPHHLIMSEEVVGGWVRPPKWKFSTRQDAKRYAPTQNAAKKNHGETKRGGGGICGTVCGRHWRHS